MTTQSRNLHAGITWKSVQVSGIHCNHLNKGLLTATRPNIQESAQEPGGSVMTHAERMDKDTGGQAVTGSQAPDTFGRSIPFTIDGQPFTTEDPSQKAQRDCRGLGFAAAREVQLKDLQV